MDTPIPADAPIRRGRLRLRGAEGDPHRLIGGAWHVEALHDGPTDELRLTVSSRPNTDVAASVRITLNRYGRVIAVHPIRSLDHD